MFKRLINWIMGWESTSAALWRVVDQAWAPVREELAAQDAAHKADAVIAKLDRCVDCGGLATQTCDKCATKGKA